MALALKGGMRYKSTSTVALATALASALATPLAAASFGITLAAPALSAQTTTDQVSARKADRELMQKVRKAVVSDKSLSTTAHNVNITSQDGIVMLRGTVKSEQEKRAIEDKATEIAGAGKVTNELSVTPGK
jgi:hyperosmotically inducible periplasmic protein